MCLWHPFLSTAWAVRSWYILFQCYTFSPRELLVSDTFYFSVHFLSRAWAVALSPRELSVPDTFYFSVALSFERCRSLTQETGCSPSVALLGVMKWSLRKPAAWMVSQLHPQSRLGSCKSNSQTPWRNSNFTVTSWTEEQANSAFGWKLSHLHEAGASFRPGKCAPRGQAGNCMR